jgi:hypothetical protein
MKMSDAPKMEVYWPRGERVDEVKQPASRPGTLDGKTVAFLWDDLFRGDEIFATLQEGLKAKYPSVKFITHDTFGSTHGSDEQRILAELPEKLPRLGVDAVISGMGC